MLGCVTAHLTVCGCFGLIVLGIMEQRNILLGDAKAGKLYWWKLFWDWMFWVVLRLIVQCWGAFFAKAYFSWVVLSKIIWKDVVLGCA